MTADLIILDGCTFFYTDRSGDVEAEEADGFFYADVRHLARWVLLVDGKPVEPLTSRRVDYYSARIVGTPQVEGDAPLLSVERNRFVSEGLHEDIAVQNHGDEPRKVGLEFVFESDFADVMEAQSGGHGEVRQWGEARARSAVLWSDRQGYRRGTAVTFSPRGQITKERARFDLDLRPRER